MEDEVRRFLSVSSGSGYGDGSGSGYGDGSGSGDGSGYGSGDGDGDGDGDGLIMFNGEPIYKIDGVSTILRQIHGDSFAKGVIINSDLTLTPCFVAKQNDKFAHGATLHAAREALLEKLFDDMLEADRIQAFVDFFDAGKAYPNRLFFDWHHRLTGSCQMGREQFAKDHGIDVENGSMTPEAFIALTENAYGSSVIRKLKPHYFAVSE